MRDYTAAAGYGRGRGSDDDEDSPRPPMGIRLPPYAHYVEPRMSRHIHFYIDRAVGDPHEYTDMTHTITYAGPEDVVFIHLNTPGGNIETGIQIINSMQNSQATIVTILESTAKSLGTLIFLAGDHMVVNDNCMMMFHNFSATFGGKGGEITAQLDAINKWFSTFARKIYIPFLSEDEFTRIIKGEDLWLHSSDIRKRLDKIVKNTAAEEKKPTRKSKQSTESL